MLQGLSNLFARMADALDPRDFSILLLEEANKEIIKFRQLEVKTAAGEYGDICAATQEQFKKVHLVCENVTDAFARKTPGQEDPVKTIQRQVAALREYQKTAPLPERGYIDLCADLYENVSIVAFDFGDRKDSVDRRRFLGLKR